MKTKTFKKIAFSGLFAVILFFGIHALAKQGRILTSKGSNGSIGELHLASGIIGENEAKNWKKRPTNFQLNGSAFIDNLITERDAYFSDGVAIGFPNITKAGLSEETPLQIDGAIAIEELKDAKCTDTATCAAVAERPLCVTDYGVLALCDKPVVLAWAAWKNSGACSRTCGGGTQRQVRTCTLDGKTVDNKKCAKIDGGNASRTQACNTQACPAPTPTWSGWTRGTCSKTCGGGTRTDTRTCSVAGKCTGSSTQTVSCNTQACATAGWSSWSSWSACSKSCGGGTQTATRTCKLGEATINVNQCLRLKQGGSSKSQSCNTQICSVDAACGIKRNTCKTGVANDRAVNDTSTQFKWSCSSTGKRAICSVNKPRCGTNKNTCTVGTANDAAVSDTSTEFRWRCTAPNGGGSGTCRVRKPVKGVCGSNNGKTLSSKPTTNLCSSGTASRVLGSGPWTWSCSAPGGNASCRAEKKIIPKCGTADGKRISLTAPNTSSELCSAGSSSRVSGQGAPWEWTCTVNRESINCKSWSSAPYARCGNPSTGSYCNPGVKRNEVIAPDGKSTRYICVSGPYTAECTYTQTGNTTTGGGGSTGVPGLAL